MGRVNGINQYKHGITRTYLNLDDAGNCYVQAVRGGYLRGDWESELGKLEACLATLGANLATAYDEEFIAQKRKALLEHGISLLTIEMEPREVKIH